jgi:hypothetical protein
MWDKLKKYLSYTWASPITLFGIVYVSAYRAMGWYRWYGVEGDALVWLVNNDKIPVWLSRYWDRWSGHASGQVVVLRYPPDIKPLTLRHEQKHVDQALRLGIFWPIFYYGSSLGIKLGCPGSDPYYDNPLEVDARRYAGQIVDVVGTTKKLLEKKK